MVVLLFENSAKNVGVFFAESPGTVDPGLYIICSLHVAKIIHIS